MKKPDLALMIAIISVSFSPILIRWSESVPLAIALYRVGFNTLFLLPFVILWKREEISKLGWKRVGISILIGALLAAHFSLWITSLKMTTVASSVILVTSHPFFVAIIAHFFLKERLSKVNYIGICVSIFGVVVLSSGDLEAGNLMGDILAFIAGLCAGLYILGGRIMRKDISLITYAFMVYFFCFLFLLMACVVEDVPLYPYPQREIALFVVMALVPGMLGHTVYNWVLKHVKASIVSISLLMEPIIASILAIFIFGEIPSWLVVIGGSFILVGIFMTIRKVRKKKRRSR